MFYTISGSVEAIHSDRQQDRAVALLKKRGMLRLSEFIAAGITSSTVSRMEKKGQLRQLGRGLYQLPDALLDAHHSLAEIAKLVPRGVICLESALAFHELTDRIPSRVWVAIGFREWRPRIKNPPVEIIQLGPKLLTAGIKQHVIEGVKVSIYEPAKTVADLFYRAFRADLRLYLDMLSLEPGAVACDLHPDYLSTRWAHDQGLPVIEVQHHHAHAASCLAEHGECGPALALVLDGTGLGADGTLWGGEVLGADLASFERRAWLEPLLLPGGEAAIREPWRVAAAALDRAGRPVPWAAWAQVRAALSVNAPLSSGAGRLFDAAAALLGVRERVSYEGQAAIELEHLAGSTPVEPYPCSADSGVVRGSELLLAVADDLAAGRPREKVAAAFHDGVALAFARACLTAGDEGTVVLSGGTFQNLRLLDGVVGRLETAGRRVLEHRRIPPNDAGISVGQAAVAAARMSSCA